MQQRLKQKVTMKKIILALLVLTMAVAVQAQDKKSGEHKNGTGHHETMYQQLNLTADQKAKIKTQNESFHQQMEALKKNDNMTVKEWKSKKEALRKDQKAGFESILTSDQK